MKHLNKIIPIIVMVLIAMPIVLAVNIELGTEFIASNGASVQFNTVTATADTIEVTENQVIFTNLKYTINGVQYTQNSFTHSQAGTVLDSADFPQQSTSTGGSGSSPSDPDVEPQEDVIDFNIEDAENFIGDIIDDIQDLFENPQEEFDKISKGKISTGFIVLIFILLFFMFRKKKVKR